MFHHSSTVAFRGFAIGTLIYLTVKFHFNTILYFGKRKGCLFSFSVFLLLKFLRKKKYPTYTNLFSLDTILNLLYLYLENLEKNFQNLVFLIDLQYKMFASEKNCIIIITPFCAVVTSFVTAETCKNSENVDLLDWVC